MKKKYLRLIYLNSIKSPLVKTNIIYIYIYIHTLNYIDIDDMFCLKKLLDTESSSLIFL
jgi:hypothetical protein